MKAGQVLSTVEFPGLDDDQAAHLQARLGSLRDTVPPVGWCAEVETPVERRGGADRRQVGERRSAIERRLSLQSAVDQIHGALKLLTQVAESEATTLSEDQRRELEGAMLRLRFALERLEEG